MSTARDVEVTYDVGNDFFRLWLDERMNYTCGLHENAATEEEAQLAKLRFLADAAGVRPGMRVLDVGCGWGAMLEYLTVERGVAAAHGLTLSRGQFEHVSGRALPRASVELCSYLDYQPAERFDAVISIGMLEHAATPEQGRSGEHVGVYAEYFRRIHSWTRPGARFGLQLVHTLRTPRRPEDLRDLGRATRTVFPGAFSPYLQDVASAVTPHWEILSFRSRRLDYAQTSGEWLRRLAKSEALIRARWGHRTYEDYEHYLRTCVRMFEGGYQSLGQYELRRIDRAGEPHEDRRS
jgi:cyclopropane-fatty-acyl-phospholipid synthase